MNLLRPIGAVSLVLALGAGRGLTAQVPLDSLPPDSLLRDTVYTTEGYLKAQEANRIRLPVMPLIGVDGPLPPVSRLVLERDSLDWALAETVGDLLQRVPGVYLWRGGWLGRTEYPNFRGRGPNSVEYFLDGIPYHPVGPDSLGVDPSLFSLSLYERVDIERWPGLLRVHLFTRRHATKAPRSEVGISSGDKDIARYIGLLEYRFLSGLGLALGGERMVAPTATGTASDFDITNAWLQASFIPNARVGLQAQLFRSSPDREAFVESPDTLEFGLKGVRSDLQFRAFARGRDDGLGARMDLVFDRTSWRGSGVRRSWNQVGAIAGWRSRTLGLTAQAWGRSAITPADLRVSAGWAPAAWLSAAVDAGHQVHNGDRTSEWVGGRAGLRLLGVDLAGAVRHGSLVATPALIGDRAQTLTDWQATVQWQRPWAGVELGYASSDAFQPASYRPYRPTVDSLAPLPRTEWITVGWRLAPRQWLTLQGWYSDPRKGTPDGLPPTHSMTSVTIRSKFWRTFRSGIFDFKATLAYETWGDGIIGRDVSGQPLALDGASFWRTMIELQLDSFQLYWDRYNLQASRKTYVPGFPVLNFGSTFGVRWRFTN